MPSATSPVRPPQAPPAFSWPAALALFAAAVAVRAVLLVWVLGSGRTSWEQFLAYSDAGAYRALSQAIAGEVAPASLSLYASRVFTGWPAIVAVLRLVASEPVAMIGGTLACAGLVPALLLRLTGSRATAWLLVFVPPGWLLASVHPIAEAPFLAAGLGALLAARAERWLAAGLLAGAMTTLKPYGAFLAVGLLAAAAMTGPGRGVAVARLVAGAAVAPALAALGNVLLFGDVAYQFRAYAAPLAQLNLDATTAARLGAPSGHWGWPFAALVQTPLVVAVPGWKLLYIYAHVVLLLVLLGRAAWRARRVPALSTVEVACLGWLALNSLAIVSGGAYWGFHSFDRYFVWAWPAALLLNVDLAERLGWAAWAISLGSVGAVVFALVNRTA